jgi:ElaB/YqjD/DUF883 family membrane-anchored ribosome-binding protein
MAAKLLHKICNHLYLLKRASCESLHFTPIYREILSLRVGRQGLGLGEYEGSAMDEHPPKVRDISDYPATAASAAKAKGPLDQSSGNTHEPHREAGDMLAQAKNAASDAVEHAKAAAGEALASAAENLGEHASDQAAATAEALRRQTRRAGHRLSHYAAANPLTALLVAGAVGYGFGYLLHHSQRTLPGRRSANVENA